MNWEGYLQEKSSVRWRRSCVIPKAFPQGESGDLSLRSSIGRLSFLTFLVGRKAYGRFYNPKYRPDGFLTLLVTFSALCGTLTGFIGCILCVYSPILKEQNKE